MIDVDCPYDFVKLWASEIDVPHDSRMQRSIALSWRKVTSVTKLRYFWYKIIHKKLTTNIQVSRWNKDVSSLCSFCGYHEETVLHLYTEGEIIAHLFNVLKSWLLLHMGYCLDLLPTNMIFNTGKMHSKDNISQVIMLIAKHYIYLTKHMGYAPNLYALTDHDIYYKNIEKHIAIQNNVERRFYSKWISFMHIVLYVYNYDWIVTYTLLFLLQ